MSRTTRKTKHLAQYSLVNRINRDIAWATKSGYERIKVPKDLEQYRNEVAQYTVEYDEAYKEHVKKGVAAGSPVVFPSFRFYKYVSKYVYYEVPVSLTRVEEETKKDYAKLPRDGYCNETGRKQYFKWLTKNAVRNAYKNLKNDWEKYENIPYPNDHTGDSLVWSVW